MTKIKKKFLIFDVDGVLIDSKKNMEISWIAVQKKYLLQNVSFSNYFSNIGRPFFDILKILGINNNYKEIKKTYDNESKKNNDRVFYFDGIIKVLKELKKKKYSLNILTSKDLTRTKLFLNKYISLFDYIECDDGIIEGKPNPRKMNKLIKKLKAKRYECVYIGDTNVDYKTAKNAKIDFLFANWGYGKNYNYKQKCSKPIDLIKIF